MTSMSDTDDVEMLLKADEPADGWNEAINAAQLIGTCTEIRSTDAPTSTTAEPVPKLGCCQACRCCGVFKQPLNVSLLLLQVCAFLACCGLVAVHSVGRFKSHGYCVLTASFQADFTVDYSGYNMPCDMPLFMGIIIIAFAFGVFALNWIAGLYNSIRWLRLQTLVTVLVTALTIVCTAVLSVGLLQWCDHMQSSFDDLPAVPDCNSTTRVQKCHCMAMLYDETCEPDEKMLDVYTFTFIELGMISAISTLMCIATGLAVYNCRTSQKPLSISADTGILAIENTP